MAFPSNFVWGAAAASYQIEGAAYEDGKGLSVWDMMCRKPGTVWEQNTGDVACDHYHRFRDDVKLMQRLGLQAYRLSISWPRVMPTGQGEVNARGLAFYDQLIDALLEADVQPYVTLFHWDYPYDLYCRGGWLNPDSPDWFADYTQVIVDALSDRVQHWMTLNEPQCFIGIGHQEGRHAPGDKLDWPEVLRAAHHSLLAHGKSVQVIRAGAKATPQIGYAPVGVVFMPATDHPEDVAAAQKAMASVQAGTFWNNTWWMDPVFLGHYPEDGLAAYGAAVPEIKAGDMETIAQPLDFFGTNIYHGRYVQQLPDGNIGLAPYPQGRDLTANRWDLAPESLYWGPKFLYERYGKPIVVTENGCANIDWVSLDGKVHDPQRIDLTRRYLLQLERAGEDGVDIQGYFHWSIMDNFEWAEGYKDRFGLVYVDFNTQERIPKDSAYWYQEVIASHGKRIHQD